MNESEAETESLSSDEGDDDSWFRAAVPEPASSSSTSSRMTTQEQLILNRVSDKFKSNDVMKFVLLKIESPRDTVFSCLVDFSADQRVELAIVSRITPEGINRFSVEAFGDVDNLLERIHGRLSDCATLTSVVALVTHEVEQHRFSQLIESLHVDPGSPSNDETSSEAPSLNSGTTAASRQSSQSTTPSDSNLVS